MKINKYCNVYYIKPGDYFVCGLTYNKKFDVVRKILSFGEFVNKDIDSLHVEKIYVKTVVLEVKEEGDKEKS